MDYGMGRRFTRRTSVLTLAAFVGTTALAACGQTTEAPSAKPAPAQPQAQAAPKAGAPQPAAKPQSKQCNTTIELIGPWRTGTAVGDGIASLGKAFADTRSGCTVNTIYGGNNTQIFEKLVVAVAGGSPPDTALVPTQQTALWADKGVVAALDDYMKVSKLQKRNFFAGYWPSMEMRARGTRAVWRLPFQIDVNFPIYWHKPSFQEAGLDPEKGPATIAEMDEMALKLTVKEGDTYKRIGVVPWRAYGAHNSFQSWAYAFGAKLYDPTSDKVLVNEPKALAALEWMVGWAKRLDPAKVSAFEKAGQGGHTGALAQGRFAIHLITSASFTRMKRINTNLPNELGGDLMVSVPPVPRGPAWLSGRGIGIVSNTKNPDAAWDFVRWAGASNEGTLATAKTINAVVGFVGSPGFEFAAKDPLLAPAVRQIKVAPHVPPGALVPIKFVLSGVQEAIDGKRSAREVLDELNRKIQEDLNRERARAM